MIADMGADSGAIYRERFAPLVGADTVESLAGLVLAQAPERFALAGHLPTLEQPEATNAALRRWLEN